MLKLCDAHQCLVITNLNTNHRAWATCIILIAVNFTPWQGFVIWYLGTGNLTLASVKISISPGSVLFARHPGA